MLENDEDVVHAGIVSKSQNIPEFRPILEFATDTWVGQRTCRFKNRPYVGCSAPGERPAAGTKSALALSEWSWSCCDDLAGPVLAVCS
jgi:hypothetical protein